MSWKRLLTAVVLGAFSVVAAEVSGGFSTSFMFRNPGLDVWNALELRFSFANLQLQSISSWQNLGLSAQAFTLTGDFENLRIQAGVVLQPVGGVPGVAWTTQNFEVLASFISFELRWGNIRLKLTLQGGTEGY